MVKLAKRSMLSSTREPYVCAFAWPEDCFVQCGDNGFVFTQKGGMQAALSDPVAAKQAVDAILGLTPPEEAPDHYRTAFFEAAPKSPDTFIRGEGTTIEDAEKDAWDQWQRVRGCPGHEYETRGYTNGAGFCRHCGLFSSGVFPVAEGGG